MDSLAAFRAHRLSLLDLAKDLENTANAMEGDVPRQLREGLMRAAGGLELESFGADRAVAAEAIIRDFESIVRSNYPLSEFR
jgi:hypothetical protein